jgi:hypothetical protein
VEIIYNISGSFTIFQALRDKKVTFSPSIEFQISNKLLEIKEFKHSICFGSKIADKSKKRK